MQEDLLGDLFTKPDNNVYIDGDTVKDLNTGDSLRIAAVDTPEVSKITKDGLSYGDVGGRLTANLVSSLAAKEGYEKPLISGEKDAYGRYLGDMVNQNGSLLSDKLLESGLANLTIFSSPEQVNTALAGRLEREQRKLDGTQNEWDIAKDLVNIEREVLTEGDIKAKPIAIDERQYAMSPGTFDSSSVMVRSDDRTLDNKARSSLSTAFAMGTSNMMEGAWGAWDLIGDTIGFDDNGKPNVERLQREIADMPILENQSAFDKDGDWTLDSASKFTDFVITNAAMSAPYMVSTILSVAAAPFTYGASLAIPAVIYTGQTYNEQEEKNAPIALASGVAQGVLDYFGLKAVNKAAGGFIKDAATRKEVVKELAEAKFGGDLLQAEKALGQQTIKELTNISKVAKDSLASQFGNKYIGISKDTGKAFLKGSAGEALTETTQEFIGALGATNFDLSKLDENELQNRLLNAAVAGGTLGGTLSAVGQAKVNVGIMGALDAQKAPNLAKTSNDFKYQQELKAKNAPTDIDSVVADSNQDIDLNDLAKPHKEGGSFSKSLDNIKEEGFSQLWRGFAANLNNRFGSRSESLRKLFAIVNGNNIYSNGGIEDYQHLTESSLANVIGSEQEALNSFQVNSLRDITSIFNNKTILDTFKIVTESINSGQYFNASSVSKAKNIELPPQYKNHEDAIYKYMDKFFDYNRKVEQLSGNYKNILEQKTFNKLKINSNRNAFVEALKSTGMSETKANELMHDILEIPNIQETTDLFDINLFNEPLTASQVDLNALSNNPEVTKFLNDDIFYNLAAINGTTAAKAANYKFLGDNGNRLAYYINDALSKGEISPEEAAYLASEMKDFVDIRKGEYKRIENPTWRSFQENALFYTTLNQLPLATLSSLVELGLITNGLNKSVIFDKGFIADSAKQAAKEIYDWFNEGAYKASRGLIKRVDTISKDPDRKALFELGFLQESQSVAQRNDINMGANRKQRGITTFFRFIGLQSLTNITRTARLSLAGDAINGWVYDVATETPDNITKQTLAAREALIELGVDIDFMVRMYNNPTPSEVDLAKYEEQMRLASFRFVNQAIAHPTKSNRPKFYQNPRTAIFFQFQGFLSTFTANILPKIYSRMLGTNTTLDNRLHTIGTFATLIALGFFAQYLRDLAKYGEETPYLDDWGKFQRAIGSSGIMGTGERVVNTVFPLYDTSTDGWIDAAIEQISGQAPVLGYAGKIGDMGVSIFEDKDNAPSRIIKAAPITGPVNWIGWKADDLFN